jgi:hypothetical protein
MKNKYPNKYFSFLNEKNQPALLSFLGLTFCVLTLLPSCQSPLEKEDSPHQIADYFVRYLAAERQLKAYASFFEGDSLRTATTRKIQGIVTFQGATMEKRELGKQGIRYTITRTADYDQPFRFTHQNDDGERIERAFSMPPLNDFFFEGNISRQQGATLVIKGASLGASESLVLLFTDAKSRAYTITLSGLNPENRYSLSPEQLADLPVGSNQLYLVKKKLEVRENNRQTTLVAIEYYTKTVQVEILP